MVGLLRPDLEGKTTVEGPSRLQGSRRSIFARSWSGQNRSLYRARRSRRPGASGQAVPLPAVAAPRAATAGPGRFGSPNRSACRSPRSLAGASAARRSVPSTTGRLVSHTEACGKAAAYAAEVGAGSNFCAERPVLRAERPSNLRSPIPATLVSTPTEAPCEPRPSPAPIPIPPTLPAKADVKGRSRPDRNCDRQCGNDVLVHHHTPCPARNGGRVGSSAAGSAIDVNRTGRSGLRTSTLWISFDRRAG
jgi:hypothetical protein